MEESRTPGKTVVNDGTSEPAQAGSESSPAKKPYQPPALVEYGSVAKLTQGTLSKNSDFFSGGFRMTQMCL